MHFIYTFFITLLTPFILLRLYLKGFQTPAYRQRWQERFAIYNKQHSKQSIWFHAVSVGEAEAVFPLSGIFC
jgi:3-deoxy-D-manno-octulosonic-acid transferase